MKKKLVVDSVSEDKALFSWEGICGHDGDGSYAVVVLAVVLMVHCANVCVG